MGKKKFNKKAGATFSLMFRESAAEDNGGQRVFVRTDGGADYVPGFSDDYPDPSSPSSSIPAAGATSAEGGMTSTGGKGGGAGEYDPKEFLKELLASGRFTMGSRNQAPPKPLPEPVRREILELGLPDDGYDYTKHLRVIGQPGTGISSAQTYGLGAFIPAPAPRPAAPDVKVREDSCGVLTMATA